jgi:ADP-ribosylglycohydrolase/fructose-1,6-bisphosphatase/inositol monophosphatase family enzyme
MELPMDLGPALDVATRAAREAGDLLRADFHRAGGPRGGGAKAEADVEAEDLIRGRLRDAFPDWSFLGEETGRADGKPGAPIWLVDPNDGTRDYLRGLRGSSVSIGLVHQGRAVLGVVFAFAYPDDDGDLFTWADGCGPLRRNGAPSATRLPESLGKADVVLVSAKGDGDPDGNLRGADPARYRSVPSIAHRLALVAAGEASAAVSLFAPGSWDYAGGQALLRSAGALLVDEEGREVSYAADGSSQCARAFAAWPGVAERLARQPWESVGKRALAARGGGPFGPGSRPVPGETVSDPGLLSRAHGCLLGQVVGDSLGSLVEFDAAEKVARRYPDGPRLLEDGGTWDTLAGQPTDDSEMALALARSILDNGGYDAEAALRAYREWHDSRPFDVGNTVSAALAGRPLQASQANGSLMRASPLGVLAHAASIEESARIARTDSALTHPNPVCGDAVAAYVVAIRHAVVHGDGPDAAYRAAVDWARESALPPVVEALRQAAETAPVCDGASQGFVLIAFRNAFYELLHAESLEAGVVATVRRGGDTDTNAAIAGALLGAVHGRAAVPPQWRRMILSCRPHGRYAKRPRPMIYWPVDVLEVAERLLIQGSRAAGQARGPAPEVPAGRAGRKLTATAPRTAKPARTRKPAS